ncbi:hypothetical protein ACFV9W_31815 [Streptomyces sp. NPDC059897]|uniref:hypothetical protein n=1 Tax=Streptomyces sp. NPDC059897 TaxID=3346994 RepID=UPI00366A53E4
MAGYTVEPGALRAAAKRIRGAVKGVEEVHLDKLADGDFDFGNSDAAHAFSELMATWHQALGKVLKEEGEEAAEKLDDTAGSYEGREDDSAGQFAPSAAGGAR